MPYAAQRATRLASTWRPHDVNDRRVVRVHEGWFNETLPVAPIKHISFLGLDGDIFVSTWDALVNLNPKLLSRGLVYIDDGCTYWSVSFAPPHCLDLLASTRATEVMASLCDGVHSCCEML